MILVLAILVTTPNVPGSAEQASPEPQAAPAAVPETDDELEEFVPSEKISADKAISFPVDI